MRARGDGPSGAAIALDDGVIARISLGHLERVVAIDSSSDESSRSIPSTPGQARLAEALEGFFLEAGAEVERDDFANVIATLPARGAAGSEPLALMVHLDTARGTAAVPSLELLDAWDGQAVRYPRNSRIWVDLVTYPSAAAFLGQDLVHGPGDAPFGLDDKLGLAHLMTLVRLLAEHPEIPHPELIVVARPDEEIGRMGAVEGLADALARRGVRSGYTVDGIAPFEINTENFNASRGSLWFRDRPVRPPDGRDLLLSLRGVNTHGATARAEGHRPATRLAAELLAALEGRGLFPSGVYPLGFVSDDQRDCDAELSLRVAGAEALQGLERALEDVVGPHVRRGAGWQAAEGPPIRSPSGATVDMLRWVLDFLGSSRDFPLAAEESSGRQGYSHPFRARPDGEGLRLDLRLRDFEAEGLAAREAHLRARAGGRPLRVVAQYTNMGPRLAARPELVARARAAAAAEGLPAVVRPIRGGTGVDPFLERGVAIANLGTGYFAPESEKEFTSLQMMARHARWLLALVREYARP